MARPSSIESTDCAVHITNGILDLILIEDGDAQAISRPTQCPRVLATEPFRPDKSLPQARVIHLFV